MKEYKITYYNDNLRVISIDFIQAKNKKQAENIFKEENKGLKYVGILDIEEAK